jgi:hypothetical protein
LAGAGALISLLLALVVLADPPANPETQSSALTAALTANETLRLKLQEQRDDNFWSVLKTAIGTLAASSVAIGGAAKWWANTRIERIKLEHSNEMERLREAHKQAVELARVSAETKRAENDDDLKKLRKDFDGLQQRMVEEERRCHESLSKIGERLAKEEAKSDALQSRLLEYKEQLIVLQATGRQSAFSSWTVDFSNKIVDVTPAFERGILVPLGKTRDGVERQPASAVLPAALAALIKFLDEEAAVRPGHIAGALNVRVDPHLPPLAVVKVLATDQFGRAYGIQGVAIPMSAFIDVPDGIIPPVEPTPPKGKA